MRLSGTATAVVCGLLVAGFFLPVWEMRADVRVLGMFPDPFITLRFSGTGVTGELDSFNRFGKMFGIRPLQPEGMAELRLYPLAVAAALAVTLLSAARGAAWHRLAALVLLWGLPVGAIAFTQLRLAYMAYTRDPLASYYMEIRDLLLPVFGTKQILGATVYTVPGPGLLLFLAAAVLYTLAYRRKLWQKTLKGGMPHAAAD